MTSKERVLTAVARQQPDRVPLDFSANAFVLRRLYEELGVANHRHLLSQLHVDIVDLRGVVDPVYCGPIPKERMLKARFGARLCLHGSIDTQHLLPRGTPAEVAETVRSMCRVLGPGGGFILAPCHVLQMDVPTANILALYDTGFGCGQ